MKRQEKIFLIIAAIIYFIFLTIILTSCTESEFQEYEITGKIIVVGNMPFSRLALETEQQLYILEFNNKFLEKCIWQEQGNTVKVKFIKKYEAEGNINILIIYYERIDNKQIKSINMEEVK